MNQNIQRMMDWVDCYHTCAVNHVPSDLYTDFPDAWCHSGTNLEYIAKRYSEVYLRFKDGELVGHSRYKYSRERSSFDDLDAYIDFADLIDADMTMGDLVLSLEEVL